MFHFIHWFWLFITEKEISSFPLTLIKVAQKGDEPIVEVIESFHEL